MPLGIFGIRHHGPGCARSLRAALDELQPDVLVMEGPADAEDALPLAAHAELKPPVAMLIYPPDEPRRAVYYPFAEFSPEWQAIRWALGRGVPVRLMDLPQSHQLAIEAEAEKTAEEEAAEEKAAEEEAAGDVPDAPGTSDTCPTQSDENDRTWRTDPLALLAEAAGYKDHELWWEQQVERRENAAGLFEAILEAMRTVREETGEPREQDLLREAHMRKVLRGVVREGHERIAVVCGAWHAPVLDEESLGGKREGLTAKDDEARLKGLPKRKTATTWIPWTFSRLAYRSGYGAGVESPGWYAHLWQSPAQAATRWVATAARLLREKDLDASSASVIEAVRLADALAAIRDLRSPGLAELSEAILTVLCHGDGSPMRLVRRRLEIGDVLGQVPSDAPSTPLARDLAELQKRLRLKPSSEIRHLDLDLRKENDLARSHLLHRLRLLDIPWGALEQSGGRASTFHEIWQVEWKPEFAVAIIEANVWGNTVEAAATARAVHDAHKAAALPEITELLDTSILAGLDDAVQPLLARIQSQSAVASDVRHLMDAVLPLARVARYGDVRGTQAGQVVPILIGMYERALVGLPAACSSLDDEAAARMLESIGRTQQALDILNRAGLQDEWHSRLRTLMQSSVHGLLRGWCCRLLLEKGSLDEDELYHAARLALSSVNPPAECAAWATGLLKGSGLLLLHQDGVWQVFDRWLSELPGDTFVEMLPLLRRAFADFTHAERRQMGEKVKHLRFEKGPTARAPRPGATAADLDLDRARLALPVLAQILGVPYDDDQR
jgi:hypothetical protein